MSSAAAITVWFGRAVWLESGRSARASRVTFAIAAVALTLLLVRQTMEIEVVLEVALIQVRSLEATQAAVAAVLTAAFMAFAWTRIARRLSHDARRTATLTFIAVFLVQSLVYAFHESAEAGVLPWSEVLHVASEPYGPEGVYGRGVSYLLFVLPLVSIVVMPARDLALHFWHSSRRRAFVTASILGATCVVLILSLIHI